MKTFSLRKKVIFATLSGMTVLTLSACNWQYQRYNYSVRKWKTLDLQFKAQNPKIIHFTDLPWAASSINEQFQIEDYEYQIISIEGFMRPERYFVHRTYENRPGYLVIGLLSSQMNESSQTIAINLGWIPALMIEEFKKIPTDLQRSCITAMIKRPELVDQINKDLSKHEKINDSYQKFKPLQTNFNSFVDISRIQQQLGDQIIIEKKLYFDKFLLSNQNSEDELELYPVCASIQTFSKPYLTPDKHLSYCTFWGSCSALGLLTLLRIIYM